MLKTFWEYWILIQAVGKPTSQICFLQMDFLDSDKRAGFQLYHLNSYKAGWFLSFEVCGVCRVSDEGRLISLVCDFWIWASAARGDSDRGNRGQKSHFARNVLEFIADLIATPGAMQVSEWSRAGSAVVYRHAIPGLRTRSWLIISGRWCRDLPSGTGAFQELKIPGVTELNQEPRHILSHRPDLGSCPLETVNRREVGQTRWRWQNEGSVMTEPGA